MTEHLTPAQQAQTENREATGKFKTKTHREVDDVGGVLGVNHREIGTLSEGAVHTGTVRRRTRSLA